MGSLESLRKQEIVELAEFFAVEVESENEEPTKKEYLLALAGEEEPITWDDYENIYLPAKKSGQDKSQEVRDQERADEEQRAADEELATADEVTEPVDDGPKTLVVMTRQNPRYDVLGYTFTKDHPFNLVPEEVANHLVKNDPGFRLASSEELKDYYN